MFQVNNAANIKRKIRSKSFVCGYQSSCFVFSRIKSFAKETYQNNFYLKQRFLFIAGLLGIKQDFCYIKGKKRFEDVKYMVFKKSHEVISRL